MRRLVISMLIAGSVAAPLAAGARPLRQDLTWPAVVQPAPYAQSAPYAQPVPSMVASPRVFVGPAIEGVGCYWERGRQYCSRYCYVEVDGRRYCRERERDAHSQAPALPFEPYEAAPMK